MITKTSRKNLSIGFAFVILLVQSACGAQTIPNEAVDVNTATPIITSTSANTATPEVTATFTETPAPTATFTPAYTPTTLPEITPAVEGKGNVIGLVLWNHQPVPQAAVWLCEKFEGDCLGKYQYRTNTDKNGYYIFDNVTPGKYLVAINSFSTGWFIFYFDSDGNREQEVSAGENLVLEPWSIWKFDLKGISPRSRTDISSVHPTFSWEAYPDAAYYLFYIYDKDFNEVLEYKQVNGTEFVLEDVELVTCTYYWYVEAYNSDDIKISDMSDYMNFINHSVPGTC